MMLFLFLLSMPKLQSIFNTSTTLPKTKTAGPKYVNIVIASHHLDLHQNFKAVSMKITMMV